MELIFLREQDLYVLDHAYATDDYEIVCWDVVSDPSTPGAFIASEKSQLQQYVEAKKPENSNNVLFEKLEKFNGWLQS